MAVSRFKEVSNKKMTKLLLGPDIIDGNNAVVVIKGWSQSRVQGVFPLYL